MSPTVRGLTYGAAATLGAILLASSWQIRQGLGSALFIPAAHAQATSAAKAPPVPSTVTAAGITLHSVSVDLPGSDRMFPGGASAEAINNTCLACHSAGMVLNQPPLSPAAWGEEVGKMRTLYKAPVAKEDVPAIVAYLGKLKPGK